MSGKEEEEEEICYAALAFHKYQTPGSRALPFKIRNQNNSRKESWSARRTPSTKAPSIDKSLYNEDEEDMLSPLPEMRLPAPPPPRTHSTALCQTDETDMEQSPWMEHQKLLLFLGLVVFTCFAAIMNLVTWDMYIKKDDSSAKGWCLPLPGADTGKEKLPPTTIQRTSIIVTKPTIISTTKLTTPSTITTKPTTTTTSTTTMFRTTQTPCDNLQALRTLSLHNKQNCHYLHFGYGKTIWLEHFQSYIICSVRFDVKYQGREVGIWIYDVITVYLPQTSTTCKPSKEIYYCNAKDESIRFNGTFERQRMNYVIEGIELCNVRIKGIDPSRIR